ncbi:MAG TPA: YHS domain-containing protein [archaeon]|nr:YHS domain-containing protein [archaeon]
MKDLVCGMEIEEKSSLKTEYRNNVYHFCSETCRNMFDKIPQKFVKKAK